MYRVYIVLNEKDELMYAGYTSKSLDAVRKDHHYYSKTPKTTSRFRDALARVGHNWTFHEVSTTSNKKNAYAKAQLIVSEEKPLYNGDEPIALVKKVNEIWVTFEKEGVHKYPAALTDPKLATGDWDDVSFLGHPHRHMFKFRVSLQVFHDDRDVEFIQFKRWLERLYSQDTLKLDYKSCEMISDDLANQIFAKYPGRVIKIEVSEDGENGSYAEYIPN